MTRTAAIYTRVSSDRQKENHTIASQVAALVEYAQTHGYLVPPEWRFQDEGYSGATLLRPGLEALRDLAAAGQIEAALIYCPDRLSRKYAYQVLLAEELTRCGVELVFLKAPSGVTAEDQLLVQFQGMIAEYERAQIAERCRRGKRHRAQQGSINVLSGAPYGYRYVKKNETTAAYYEVIDSEATVVRLVYEAYTRQGQSVNAIARMLNEQQIPTRSGVSRWERSTVWAMLRNPAYEGRACFGKTEMSVRQRITRPLRQRKGLSNRNSCNHERPRQDWVEIPVPALVSEGTFALAQEQLQQNKRHSLRRTITPSLLQGMLVCERCGYALYRTSTQTSARKLYYYRCLGSDAYRHLKGAVCDNPPVRQDHLDEVVWKELLRLLEDPSLIQKELDRRLEAAKNTDPLKQREGQLQRDRARMAKNMDRLLTAYQEDLVSLEQLRTRMPELRKKDQAIQEELQSLETASADQTKYLRLVETLSDFNARLRARATILEVAERQKVLRLLVKEILVGRDTVTIRHSIQIPNRGSDSDGAPGPPQPHQPSMAQSDLYYLLRSGRQHSPLGSPFLRITGFAFLPYSRVQPFPDESQDHSVTHPSFENLPDVSMIHGVEKFSNVQINYPPPACPHRLLPQSLQRIVSRAPWSKPVGAVQKLLLVQRFQHHRHRPLEHLVLKGRYADRARLLPRCPLGYVHPPHRGCSVVARLGPLQK